MKALAWRYPLGNIRAILGLYWDNGKENGNYYLGLGLSFSRVIRRDP